MIICFSDFLRPPGSIHSCKPIINISQDTTKLRGVGPIDNRPFTNMLQHFVKRNIFQVLGVKHFLKIIAPQLLRLGIDSVLKIFSQRMSLLQQC